MSVAVAEAGAEAAALLAALHRDGIGETGPAWDEADFAALLALPGRRALVAAEGGMPLGFVLIGVVANEAEIITLAMRPVSRRRGIGRMLLAATIAWAEGRGAARLFLEVAEDNGAARALYGSAGFAEVGRRRGYYARGAIDAIVLARSLSPSS